MTATKPRRALVTVAAVDVACPECKEWIAEPHSGALFFEINEYRAGSEHTCIHCNTVVVLPVLKKVGIRG